MHCRAAVPHRVNEIPEAAAGPWQRRPSLSKMNDFFSGPTFCPCKLVTFQSGWFLCYEILKSIFQLKNLKNLKYVDNKKEKKTEICNRRPDWPLRKVLALSCLFFVCLLVQLLLWFLSSNFASRIDFWYPQLRGVNGQNSWWIGSDSERVCSGSMIMIILLLYWACQKMNVVNCKILHYWSLI